MPVCKFYAQGRCTKGDTCNYRHGSPPAMSQVLSRTARLGVGDQTSIGSRSAGSVKASVEHPVFARAAAPTDTPSHQDTRGSVTCTFFLRGSCRNGDTCPFAHPPTDGIHSEHPPEESVSRAARDTDNPDEFSREFGGALVEFGTGASISKVALPEDLSAAHMHGLPLSITPSAVSALVHGLGFRVPSSRVRVFRAPHATTATANIQGDEPTFGERLVHQLRSDRPPGPAYSGLDAVPVPVVGFATPHSRRINCKKIHISWHRPTRLAWLNFGDEEIAERVSGKFRCGTYKVLDQTVQAKHPTYSGPSRRGFHSHPQRPVRGWTVVLEDVPAHASSSDLEASIGAAYDAPRHIEMGRSARAPDPRMTRALVASLFTDIGPNDFDASENPRGKRLKAVARFADERDAREAVRSWHDKAPEFLTGRKLTVTLVSSAKFKVPTAIYDAVAEQLRVLRETWKQIHLQFMVYRNTDSLQRFTSLKIEGEQAKDVATAANALETVLAGHLIKDGDSAAWDPSLPFHGDTYRGLKDLQREHGVVIARNKAKRQLRYFGASERYQQVQQAVVDLLKAKPRAVHAIELDPPEFLWACKGGFTQVLTAVGRDAASFDVVSTPKRIIITGAEDQYHAARNVVRDRRLAVEPDTAAALRQKDCSVCWTEAEDPVHTRCKHLYCLECFENMCISAGSDAKDFSIGCQGAMGTCDEVFSLAELRDHLSSTTFEDILHTSFTSFIRRRPRTFCYCPTPDCGYIYRHTDEPGSRTCARCFEVVCTACHGQHGAMSCAEYSYLNSGGYAAFEQYKKEKGIKDCPKCTTPMEKTEGCNHMTCQGCGVHICWVCLKTFDTARPCYDHMNLAHGSIGLDYLQEA